MKNTKFLLFAGLLCLLAVACKKDEGGFEKTLDKFVVGDTDFKSDDNSKVALQFSTGRLLYEEGDYIKVNGETYSLSKSGSGSSTVWYANGPGVTAENFYCAYADGVSTTLSGYTEGGSSYHFNLAGRMSSPTNKILLGGVTESNVLTLRPACAIIRVPLNDSYTNVKVGFERNKVLKEGDLSISSSQVTISGSTYMSGVDLYGTGADFLRMEYNNVEGYWYVAVPVPAPPTNVSTKLYLYWEQGTTPVGYVTSGQVTLSQGYVYTVGSSRQSPFNVDGTSKSQFRVDGNSRHLVRFSPGNLQARFSGEVEWRFSASQKGYEGTSNGYNMDNYEWFDLFGFGTSEWNSGSSAYYSNSTDEESNHYIKNSLTGANANADWGVYNGSSIKYGEVTSGTSWRTLTNDEWSYLISRTGKWGLATVSGTQGLILIPDLNISGQAWNNERDFADCPEFTAGATSYSTNNYTDSQWAKLEAAGVIFLPAAGHRMGTSVTLSGNARYWTSTYSRFDDFDYLAYALSFQNGSISVTDDGIQTSRGCSVRLIHQQW